MTLEDRIAAIENREAIADLVMSHAEHIRSGTIAEAGDLFFSDAVYELAWVDPDRPGEIVVTERIEGVESILGGKDVVAGEGVRLCPMIHNLRIAIDGETASSTCVSMTTLWPMGNNFIGEYRDRYRREAGVWRFSVRVFVGLGTIDGTSPEAAGERYQAEKAVRAALASG